MKLLFEDWKKEIEEFNKEQGKVKFTGWTLIQSGKNIAFTYKKDELDQEVFDFDIKDFNDYLLSESVIKREIEFLVKDLAYDNLYNYDLDSYDTYVFIAKTLQQLLYKIRGGR